ncbi:MAG TPA: hypothetical protein VJV23_04430 [Candidatus Polarisedimenticolia bacterium]|nr:hypothetical protein [Candidatus Polarisedimenticolia bacterium]
MKRWSAVAILGLLLVLTTPAASAAGGPWRVSVWQSGVATDQVQVAAVFEVKGAGFHAKPHPVKVCLSGSQCQLADLQQDGTFLVSRTILSPGTYNITVHQAKDSKLMEWHLRAEQQITVQ